MEILSMTGYGSAKGTVVGLNITAELKSVNNRYLDAFEHHGMMCAGCHPEAHLVEIVEIPALKWYIGTQFHPEYSSTVLHPHPLFMDFIKSCIDGTAQA